MKSLFKLLVLSLVLSFVLSACSSGLTISKRRYTKGFYVHQSGKPSQTKRSSTEKSGSAAVFNSDIEPVSEASAEERIYSAAPAPTNGKKTITASAKKPLTQQKDYLLSRGSSSSIEMAIKDPVKTIKELKYKVATGDAAGEALSLLWILILILAIAYIAGLLLDNFGLGWVIHILLVVILVLLILWLLRVL